MFDSAGKCSGTGVDSDATTCTFRERASYTHKRGESRVSCHMGCGSVGSSSTWREARETEEEEGGERLEKALRREGRKPVAAAKFSSSSCRCCCSEMPP